MIGNLLKYMYAKNYRNRSSSDKAVAKIRLCSFFASRGITVTLIKILNFIALR